MHVQIPGRPQVIYQLREYSSEESGGAAQARLDVPFLFKAFETGQIGPKRLAKMHGGKAKARTIHEYLDWTVTENKAEDDDELVSPWTPAKVCIHRVNMWSPRCLTVQLSPNLALPDWPAAPHACVVTHAWCTPRCLQSVVAAVMTAFLSPMVRHAITLHIQHHNPPWR